jgi:hypothetical protein
MKKVQHELLLGGIMFCFANVEQVVSLLLIADYLYDLFVEKVLVVQPGRKSSTLTEKERPLPCSEKAALNPILSHTHKSLKTCCYISICALIFQVVPSLQALLF